MTGFQLLRPKPGVCQMCAVDHPPEHPHNCESLYYQYAFYRDHGRWPLWADAIAHCSEEIREAVKAHLIEVGAWVEPTPENTAPEVLPDGKSIGHVTVMPLRRKRSRKPAPGGAGKE